LSNETNPEMPANRFGRRRIYYNNFAAHLLNSYNPNMLYPELGYRWSDADWFALVDMIADFGFNVFEFWLVPRLFCREGLESVFGAEFARQINAVARHAHTRGLKVEAICSLATVGSDWRTLCPNLKDQWRELRFLWDSWTKRLAELDIMGIFPGDPGACSLNGCTAETYIDKSVEIAEIIAGNMPEAQVEFNTWGPPFFGWGNIEGPPGWAGEFAQGYQHTAWRFDKERADRSMTHLLRRLGDFPQKTAISINMGFEGDGNPEGDKDARPWAREIAKTNPILTWDFSLTEGENAILPHYRFRRLFARRREEREAAPYEGGICFTMSPLLNQLSLYESARSFQDPDADPDALAEEFYEHLFGPDGRAVARLVPLFEVVRDWGSYAEVELDRETYHERMTELAERLEALKGRENTGVPFHPSPALYREELLFFARLFAALSGPAPDFDALRQSYWDRVYAIYDHLDKHVDPRPVTATDNLIKHFVRWRGDEPDSPRGPIAGKWTD